jgi:hypothetical protein
MTFPITVEPINGQFAAVLLGAPHVRGQGASQAQAVASLRQEIERRMARGEILSLEIPATGLASLAGKFREDPTLRDICAEAYQQRLAELPE